MAAGPIPGARAQTTLWTATGDTAGDQFGYAMTMAGDMNGDGVDDVAVAARTLNSSGTTVGTIRLLDGTTGAKLFDFVGTKQFPVWGVVAMGDVDGDGIDDFLNGTGYLNDQVEVWSGKTRNTMFRLNDYSGTGYFITELNVGDVDQDGVDDFALGPKYATPSFRIYSSKSKTLLLTIRAPSGSSSQWGLVACALGDVNGDGWPDLLITDPWVNIYNGALYVYSLKDGSMLANISGKGELGYPAAARGDFDGDGVTDFAASALIESVGTKWYCGAVHVYSGATFSEIFHIEGEVPYQELSLGNVLGDVDGDGVPELALALDTDRRSHQLMRWIYSGRTAGRLFGLQVETKKLGEFSAVFPANDLDGDGLAELFLSRNDGANGVSAGTVDAIRGARVFLTAYPPSRKSPLFVQQKMDLQSITFYFHHAGFQAGSLVTLMLVEEDGTATSATIASGVASATGEWDFGHIFMPSHAGHYTYKVQAVGVDATGASASTAVQAIEYD